MTWARLPARSRLWWDLLFGGLMLVGVALGVLLIVESYSPVPFADFWGQLPFLQRVLDGHLRIGDFWAQLNEHRILIPRVAFALDYWLFGGRNVFLFVLIAASCLLVAALIATVVWVDTANKHLTWRVFCVAAIATMSPVAAENFTFAIQVGFPQVYLFALVAIFALLLAVRANQSVRRRRIWLLTTALAGTAATYSLANGLLVWPILVALAIASRAGRRTTLALASVGALVIFSYAWHFKPGSPNANYQHSVRHPFAAAKYVAVYLGNPVPRLGATGAGIIGVVGVVLFAVLVLTTWQRHSQSSFAAMTGASLALFVFLTALDTAVGRLNFGVAQALTSRYALSALVFWLALFIGFLQPVVGGSRRMPGKGESFMSAIFLGGAAALGIAVSVLARPNNTMLREVRYGKELTVLAFREGVNDDRRAITGAQPFDPAVQQGLRWLQQSRLGPWAPDGLVDHSRFTLAATTAAKLCRGRVEQMQPIARGLRLQGWIATPDNRAASRELAILDENQRQRGIGVIGDYRPDIAAHEAVDSDWTGFTAYIRGQLPSRITILLVGPDHQTPVCRIQASTALS